MNAMVSQEPCSGKKASQGMWGKNCRASRYPVSLFVFHGFFSGGLCGNLYQLRVFKTVADHAGGIGCALLTVHQMGPVIGWPI